MQTISASEAFNYHALFVNPSDKAFVTRLDIDRKTQAVLDDATDAVKQTLRPLLRELAEKFGIEAPYSSPRFRLQGSSVYRTQNYPAHTPAQQVDVDLGVYISASFMEGISDAGPRRQPATALAKLYFEIVDRALRKLCRERGWGYPDSDKQNQRCCRIDLGPAGVHAHIDVPLYAAPDEEFMRIVEAQLAIAASEFAKTFDSADLSRELDLDGWDDLEVIVMACRDGSWTESDVQKAIEHFRDAARDCGHPRVLRRIWRFVKSWRDFVWKAGGGPSSVLLMEITQRVCGELEQPATEFLGSGRDDRILRQVFARLGAHLKGPVWVDWGTTRENLNRAKTQEERDAWSFESSRAAAALQRAACEETLNFDQVISLVRTVFGQRISDDITLIKMSRSASSSHFAGLGPAIQPHPQSRVQRTAGA
jgi:hypothetical protein